MKTLLIGALLFSKFAFTEYNVPSPGTSMGEQKYQGRGEQDRPGSLEYNQTLLPKDKDHENYIWGRCIYDSVSTIEVPCTEGQVVLTDRDQKPVSTASIAQGKFRLSVERDKNYFIKVNSRKYQSQQLKYGPLKGGDEVLVRLVKKG
jgi:hypothetical protein